MPNSTNEVIVNGRVVMSVRGDTVTENTLVQGETAHDKTGKEIVGNLNPQSSEELNELRERVDALDEEAYRVLDRVEEIEEEDYIPFNDSDDEEHPKKKTLFASIIEKLKSIFVQKSELKKHTFEVGTDIPADSDLNTYVTEGVYKIAPDTTAQTISNVPVASGDAKAGGKLIVNKGLSLNETYVLQIYINNAGHIFKRKTTNNGTTWDGWTQLATMGAITPSQIGDGYATATVSGSVITATISGFQLRAGVIVALYFPSNVTTACTLNISNTGAKAIKNWTSHDPSVGHSIREGVNTFIYDGTLYRAIAFEKSPRIVLQDYVADTSGNLITEWGYDANKAQIKYSLLYDKLRWNHYKNSAWKGDVVLADYNDIKHQTVGIDIPANSDLNNYTTNGIYCVAQNTTAVTLVNCPSSYAGKLVVERIAGNSYIVQTYYTYHQDLAGFGGVFRRSYASSWQPWVYIANIQNDGGNRYLYLMGETTTANDKGVGIKARIKDTTTNGDYTRQILRAFQDHQATPTGFNLVIDGGGALILGGGEAGQAHYGALTKPYASEQVYITSDGNIYLQANATPIANRIGYVIDANGNLIPCKADAKVDNQGNIGWSDKKLAGVWTYKINGEDVVNASTMKDTSLDKTLRLGGLATRRIEIPDNSGWAKYIKFCDVTTWYTSTTTGQSVLSFVGWLLTAREGGYASRSEVTELELAVGYEKSTTPNSGSLILSTSNGTYMPVVLKEVLNNVTKYYLALRVDGSGRQGFLLGHFKMNDYSGDLFDGNWVNCTDANGTLPTGYSVEINGRLKRNDAIFATCTTAGDQQNKVATIDDPFWQLRNGRIVGVKFTNTNTFNSTATNKITLNVNNTGAKPIYYNTGYPTGTNTAVFGYANRLHFYMYDGTNWVWISAGYAPDSNNRKSFYGTCSTAGDQRVKVVTLADTNGWELRAGTIVGVKFTNSNTYSATSDNKIQLNVNNSGAKNIYYNTGYPTGTSQYVCGYANRTQYYMYNGTDWVWISAGVEVDTVDPRALGSGYGICETAEATTAKVATLASYTLRTGGIVSVRFAYNVPANSTLNINSRGAKPIYQRTWAIPADVIKTGDIATFVYDGSHYVLLGTDRTERQFANYRYANSAGTPDTTYLTRNDTSVLFPELSYIKRGDVVMFGCIVKFASSKTYSAGTKIATLAYSSLQICYPHASFYIGGNGLYIRNGTYNGNYYLQCTYIGI